MLPTAPTRWPRLARRTVLALWRAARIAAAAGREAPQAKQALERAVRTAHAAVVLRQLRVELAADWCAVLGVRIAVPNRDRLATANLTAAGYSVLTLDDELAPSALLELVAWIAAGCRTQPPKHPGIRLAKDAEPGLASEQPPAGEADAFGWLLLPEARPEFASLGERLAGDRAQAGPERLAELAMAALAEDPSSHLRAELLAVALQHLLATGNHAAANALVTDCVTNPALPGDAAARLQRLLQDR